MNIKNIKNTLQRFSEQDLDLLKRFLEIVIRQYNFEVLDNDENTTYFNIDVKTVKEAGLPIITIRQFTYKLSGYLKNFININGLHKEDYYRFQKYKEHRVNELRDIGEELGYSGKEIEEEIVNNFDGVFIENPDNNFIKSLEETIKIINCFKNETSFNSRSNSKQRVFILDDKLGLIDPVNEKNRPYPIQKTRKGVLTGSYKLMSHLCLNDKVVLSKLYKLMNTESASNVLKRIEDINKRFKKIFREKDDLITHLGTGGYEINEKFKLEKQERS